MAGSRIATQEEWAAAREELLAREKEYTRLGDDLARRRRELPWVAVEKGYRFDTDDGTRSPSFSTAARSSLSITSCSGRTTKLAARPARRSRTQ